MSALPLALRSARRAGARSLGLIGGRGSAAVIYAPPPPSRGAVAVLATPSALTDRGTERQGYRQAHVQAMPGEAAGAELPLPEAGGPGSRTGETAPAPLSGSIPFLAFSLLHPSATTQSPPLSFQTGYSLHLHLSPTPKPQDFVKAWAPQTASS